jgi:hypothetical protein
MSKSKLRITLDDTQHKGPDEIPNPNPHTVPTELKPVKSEPLPEIKIPFSQKVSNFFRGMENVITKTFDTVQQIPTVVKDFKYGAALFLMAAILIVLLYFFTK